MPAGRRRPQVSLPPDHLSPLAGISQSQCSHGTGGLNAYPEQAGDHAAGTGAFLTCTKVKKTEGADIQNNISVDQVAANILGQETALPSLEIGLDSGSSVGGCDSGYSCAYTSNISWAGPQTPVAKSTSPQVVFDRLFTDGGASLPRKKKPVERPSACRSWMPSGPRPKPSRGNWESRTASKSRNTWLEWMNWRKNPSGVPTTAINRSVRRTWLLTEKAALMNGWPCPYGVTPDSPRPYWPVRRRTGPRLPQCLGAAP